MPGFRAQASPAGRLLRVPGWSGIEVTADVAGPRVTRAVEAIEHRWKIVLDAVEDEIFLV
jgi:hypothetical protein